MRTRITAQHCEISDTLRDRAKFVLARLAKYAHRPQYGYAVFREDGGARLVELTLRAARNKIYHASADARDFQTALDRARAKIRRQLDHKRRHSRVRA